ncbi:endonuclease III [Vulcanibacillus modesticaldus]|uniref:Endonuclease III n=1 Tax=Vulcanibacillus modesticaldus TaxID=337097 RepID=A0A1D2YSZ8_9BACI|nr:endonuclease III [Vulcanibacillus modesticaldus]OEF98801.1 endonuclease III [Vulcanibacillus modesticaldus]
MDIECNVNIDEILKIFAKLYPEAKCELLFSNPFELLIATILSAQSTDKKVNQITPTLFKKYKTPADFLKLSQGDLEEEIKQIGLYRSKSRNILKTSKILVEKFDGQVPRKREDLESLPGVGRKTANVVLSNAFGVPTIAVDTHVFRVSNRIGLADSDKVSEVERQLMEKIPKYLWVNAHHWLIWHGRRVCSARKPKCQTCSLKPHCCYGKNNFEIKV